MRIDETDGDKINSGRGRWARGVGWKKNVIRIREDLGYRSIFIEIIISWRSGMESGIKIFEEVFCLEIRIV
jgi:hypothetical protein